MKKSISDRLVIVAIIAGVLVVIYYFNLSYQTALGQKALARSGLTSIPLEEALAQARNQSRPVLVEVAAIWSSTGRAMDEYVFADPRVKEFINSQYLFSRLEYGTPEANTFMADHKGSGYLNLWIVDGSGNTIKHVPIMLTPERFIEAMP